MASPAKRQVLVRDENRDTVSPGKMSGAHSKPVHDAAKRPILRDLTPNKALSSLQHGQASGGYKSTSTSPLKREYKDILNEDKGFTYLKRRRLSPNGHANNDVSIFARIKKPDNSRPAGPLSPPSSGRHDAVALHKEGTTIAATTTTAAAAAGASAAEDTIGGAHGAAGRESDSDSGRESQRSNATRGSFDSLINYDPSSQQALASQALNFVNVPPAVASSVSAHKQTRTPGQQPTATPLIDTVRAQAETLRLRLKVAIYKVRTNQINVPFSRLRVPEPAVKPSSSRAHAHPRPQPTTLPSPSLSRADGDDDGDDDGDHGFDHHDVHKRHNNRNRESIRNSNNSNTDGEGDAEGDDDALPTTTRLRPTPSNLPYDDSLPYGLGLYQPALDMTPNPLSRSFMPLSRAPSSSPPYIQMPPSSLPRHALTRETPPMGRSRVSHDHDSLDSEATELAEDGLHDGGGGSSSYHHHHHRHHHHQHHGAYHVESPSRTQQGARRPAGSIFAANSLPR